MRRFIVYRRGDLSATHDANQVNPADEPQFEGVVFSDGTVAVRWLTACRSTSVWPDFDTLLKVHGHTDPNSNHGTDVKWIDPISVNDLKRLYDRLADAEQLATVNANRANRALSMLSTLRTIVKDAEVMARA